MDPVLRGALSRAERDIGEWGLPFANTPCLPLSSLNCLVSVAVSSWRTSIPSPASPLTLRRSRQHVIAVTQGLPDAHSAEPARDPLLKLVRKEHTPENVSASYPPAQLPDPPLPTPALPLSQPRWPEGWVGIKQRAAPMPAAVLARLCRAMRCACGCAVVR